MTPAGLSIDRDNGDIFVSDYWANIIQVFAKKEIIWEQWNHKELLVLLPTAISLHHLFVICNYQHSIYKLDKVSGDILFRDETDYYICGLSIDTDTLYAGMYELIAYLISMLRIWDLSIWLHLSLHLSHITQDTWLVDLKLAPSLFIVLFERCTYPAQSFSRYGNLIRLIEPHEQLIGAWYFCLDRNVTGLLIMLRCSMERDSLSLHWTQRDKIWRVQTSSRDRNQQGGNYCCCWYKTFSQTTIRLSSFLIHIIIFLIFINYDINILTVSL